MRPTSSLSVSTRVFRASTIPRTTVWRSAAADVDTDLSDRERRERVQKRIRREEIRLERERHAGGRQTLDGGARKGKVLRVRDERRLLDVDERRTGQAESADLGRDRV